MDEKALMESWAYLDNPDENALLSMINLKASDFGRFRYAFLMDNMIVVCAREGGDNGIFRNKQIFKNPYFDDILDDEDDRTYCYYYFIIPEEYKENLSRFKE